MDVKHLEPCGTPDKTTVGLTLELVVYGSERFQTVEELETFIMTLNKKNNTSVEKADIRVSHELSMVKFR